MATSGKSASIRNRIRGYREVPASLIDGAPWNWRTHGDEQKAVVRASLEELGIIDALKVREVPGGRFQLFDGHLRSDLYVSISPDTIVPILVTDLDEAEAKKANAIFDPSGAMAEADAEKLKALLAEIETESAELESLFATMAQDNGLAEEVTPGSGGDEFDATPAASGPTRTAVGDLWLIGGKHRLLVGDCTDPANVLILMNGEKAHLCNTDPPYGIAYSDAARVAADRTHVRPQRERRWEDKEFENDEMDGAKLQAFLESFIRAAVPCLDDHAAWYLWHPMLTQGTFFAAAAAAAADILIHRQIIWVKPGLLFGFGDYHWKHELCFYGWRRGSRPQFYGERNQTTVWEMGHDVGNGKRDHPCQKPIELFTRPMLNHTKPGEIVYEPFAGSGSQFIAAHRNNRRCFGTELEPKFADVILKRAEAEGLTVEKIG